MKNLKKLLSILFVCAFAASMIACGAVETEDPFLQEQATVDNPGSSTFETKEDAFTGPHPACHIQAPYKNHLSIGSGGGAGGRQNRSFAGLRCIDAWFYGNYGHIPASDCGSFRIAFNLYCM